MNSILSTICLNQCFGKIKVAILENIWRKCIETRWLPVCLEPEKPKRFLDGKKKKKKWWLVVYFLCLFLDCSVNFHYWKKVSPCIYYHLHGKSFACLDIFSFSGRLWVAMSLFIKDSMKSLSVVNGLKVMARSVLVIDENPFSASSFCSLVILIVSVLVLSDVGLYWATV